MRRANTPKRHNADVVVLSASGGEATEGATPCPAISLDCRRICHDGASLGKAGDRPGPYRYLPHFLGSGGPATFHLTRYPGCSSLLTPDPKVIDMFMIIGCGDPGGNFHVTRTEPVETMRLDDIKPVLDVDFIKVDAQGYELEITRQAYIANLQKRGSLSVRVLNIMDHPA